MKGPLLDDDLWSVVTRRNDPSSNMKSDCQLHCELDIPPPLTDTPSRKQQFLSSPVSPQLVVETS
jgi:hypothetical protein